MSTKRTVNGQPYRDWNGLQIRRAEVPSQLPALAVIIEAYAREWPCVLRRRRRSEPHGQQEPGHGQRDYSRGHSATISCSGPNGTFLRRTSSLRSNPRRPR